MRESDPATNIKGIGEKSARAMEKMGIFTVGDFLRRFPRRYVRYTAPVKIYEARNGETVTLAGTFSSAPVNRKGRRLTVTSAVFSDGTGKVKLSWFGNPYLSKVIKQGEGALICGRLLRDEYGVHMDQPQIISPAEYDEMMRRLQPVYSLPQGMSAKNWRKWIRNALSECTLTDILPEEVRRRENYPDIMEALIEIHFPEDMEKLKAARRRLVFEEFLLFILQIRSLRGGGVKEKNGFLFPRDSWRKQLKASLRYDLTDAQKRVESEIVSDMTGGSRMNRLVQGDVGSGKTVLAQLAMLLAAENGYQSVLMAPTEVLAHQHYENTKKAFEAAGIPARVGLLTGSMTAAEKRKMTEVIRQHEVDVIIGTHALITQKVEYDSLALVITDEQHRFGVNQRSMLAQKGVLPHTLVMSATPIPRTLAIIIYGDLDISVLDQVPARRLPIKNCVVDPGWRPKAYDFIRKQVDLGHQAYVICPMVEEGDDPDIVNVNAYTEKLREALPPYINVAMLHGKMRGREKDQQMEDFQSGKTQVLVSTTVVEVGVDVPNATVMMVENAERFGLAQLHQLRGRVGRGDAQSYCIFIDGSGKEEENKRLSVLNSTNDGFKIASEDLKLRGPGDLFGIRQSGDLHFELGDIYSDAPVLQAAADTADRILADVRAGKTAGYEELLEKARAFSPGEKELGL